MIDPTGDDIEEVAVGLDGLTRPRAILFDWDNTLVDTWAVIQDAQNHTLVAFGMEPWTMEETRARVRGSMRDAFPVLFGDRWQEAGRIFYGRFAACHLDRLCAAPGAEALLAQLAATDIYLAVVSNKQGDFLRAEVAQLGWTPYFSRVVGALDAERDKPEPEPVRMALSEGRIEPGEAVWFVGDADVDLECATRAGCVPVLLRETPPGPKEFAKYPPVAHVSGCLTLSKVLRSL